MKIEVKTLDGGSASSIDVADDIFGLEPRVDILHRVVRWQLAKRRAGTRKTKTRSEVKVSGRKLTRQKGTGRGRHGPPSVGLFRGGGRAFGPVVRSHAHSLPKKIRAQGLKYALSAKVKDSNLMILDEAVSKDGKTRVLNKQLTGLGVKNVLIVDDKEINDKFRLAARNIPNVNVMRVEGINVYDILRCETLMLTKAAVSSLEDRFK